MTLIEIILALSILLLVLLPVASVAALAIRDWHQSQDIRQLQEDLQLASFTIKGVMEEAYDYDDFADDGKADEITLYLQNENGSRPKVTIHQDGSELVVGDSTTIDCLVDGSLEFEKFRENENEEDDEGEERKGLIRVSLEVAKGERSLRNSFTVKIRNYTARD
ncbi:MAG: hypothetical protein ACLFT2_07425 [Candidatus Brocadiia bacterium]